MKKTIKAALGTAVYSLGFWMVLSFFDIIAHNLDVAPAFAPWNFFVIF